jgi:hypothetical protein
MRSGFIVTRRQNCSINSPQTTQTTWSARWSRWIASGIAGPATSLSTSASSSRWIWRTSSLFEFGTKETTAGSRSPKRAINFPPPSSKQSGCALRFNASWRGRKYSEPSRLRCSDMAGSEYGTTFVFHLPRGTWWDSSEYAFFKDFEIEAIYVAHDLNRRELTIVVPSDTPDDLLVLFMLSFEADTYPTPPPPYF